MDFCHRSSAIDHRSSVIGPLHQSDSRNQVPRINARIVDTERLKIPRNNFRVLYILLIVENFRLVLFILVSVVAFCAWHAGQIKF